MRTLIIFLFVLASLELAAGQSSAQKGRDSAENASLQIGFGCSFKTLESFSPAAFYLDLNWSCDDAWYSGGYRIGFYHIKHFNSEALPLGLQAGPLPNAGRVALSFYPSQNGQDTFALIADQSYERDWITATRTSNLCLEGSRDINNTISLVGDIEIRQTNIETAARLKTINDTLGMYAASDSGYTNRQPMPIALTGVVRHYDYWSMAPGLGFRLEADDKFWRLNIKALIGYELSLLPSGLDKRLVWRAEAVAKSDQSGFKMGLLLRGFEGLPSVNGAFFISKDFNALKLLRFILD